MYAEKGALAHNLRGAPTFDHSPGKYNDRNNFLT